VAFPCLLYLRYDAYVTPCYPIHSSFEAGLFSGLVSHVAACKVLFPRLVTQYTTSAVIKNSPAAAAISSTAAKTVTSSAPREILPSLGASGAIYAAVTVSALAFPDAQVSLIFPPFVSIPIQAGVGGLVLLDMVGIVRGWRWVHMRE
jgi:rhomboid-like protein